MIQLSSLRKYLLSREAGIPAVGEKGDRSHSDRLSLAQNSIMQMGKFLDNAPVGTPKQ